MIQAAIQAVNRLAPPQTGNLLLESDGKSLVMKSASDVARVRVVIPGEVSGDALFAVPVENLTAAVKGREELELSLDKGMLVVKGSRYSSRLSTVDAIQMDEPKAKNDEGQSWKLSPEQAKWLKTAVQAVALKSNISIESYMPVSVKLSAKGAFVSCYDNNHMAFVESKEVTGDLEVTLPLDTMNAVLEVFDGVGVAFTMTVTKNALRVRNKLVDVRLSLPDQNGAEVIAVDAVIDKTKEARKASGQEIMVTRADVQLFLDNAKSVAVKERSEVVGAAESGKLVLSVTTNSGSSKASLKAHVSTPAAFKIDNGFFTEAVGKGKEDLQIKVVDSAFIMVNGKDVTHIMAQNQG